ncbi:MAG TPA: 30S ribosomal protein S12 methylthiotransferase RimO [Oscillospiraceae bacterium]|nr:30S ribosomal protein S12 methylthiotransferase RimO [Oscillospiraceae bacterium]
MNIKVGMVSLGCSKNQVDAERMLYKIKEAGYKLSEDPALSDVVIVNTCGFIESAKQEAIDTILEFCQLKKEGRIKKVIISGCLAERYKEEVSEQIPEADAVIGIGCNDDICGIIDRALSGETISEFKNNESLSLDGGRIISTLPFFAYLKVAEGCDNRCTYCAIPLIRGKYRSKPMEKVVEEATWLADNGVREINVIAQDTTRYGEDIYGKLMLPELLTELCKIEKLKWIRILYCYPERVTDELLDVMAREEKIVKYMDLPLQHINNDILKKMNRRGTSEKIKEVIKKIKKKIPSITLRTTFITGFPGETKEQFTELCEFIKETRFDRLGCFPYSQEDGTPAASMDGQIDEDIKQHRADNIMEMQSIIAEQNNQRMIGKTVEAVTEGFDRYAECFFGRTSADAPDIDGKIFFTSENKLSLGQFVKVKIDDVMEYDLIGSVIE